jgi:cytochrome c oxidase subunit II
MFDGVSNFANSVDKTLLFTLIVSVFFLVLITVTMIYFVIKYNRKRNPKAVNVHSNTTLEVTWTVIPTILVLIMFWFGWVNYLEEANIPDDAMPIDVTAQMWKWSFKYENGKQSDSLYVPVDTPIKLNLHSLDVNHAFFVPAFRVKKDVYPGLQRATWFQAKETGRYHIACAEYCGLNHSYMSNTVIVMPKNDFNNWISDTTTVDTAQSKIN